jgi:hypothetical protein
VQVCLHVLGRPLAPVTIIYCHQSAQTMDVDCSREKGAGGGRGADQQNRRRSRSAGPRARPQCSLLQGVRPAAINSTSSHPPMLDPRAWRKMLVARGKECRRTSMVRRRPCTLTAQAVRVRRRSGESSGGAGLGGRSCRGS